MSSQSTTHVRNISRRLLGLVALPLLAACNERALLTLPVALAPAPAGALVAQCRVTGAERTLSCVSVASAASASGAARDLVFGGQEINVKLATVSSSYDAGAEVLSADVTLENLARQAIGTPDGVTVAGVKVFFHSGPTVTSGVGVVTVLNPDGTGTFTGGTQPYFEYPQIVRTYEISSPRTWQFAMPTSVDAFEFGVYVSAPLDDEMIPLLDRVWTGTAGASWFTDANWRKGVAPDSTSTVAIPVDSLLPAGHVQPTLGADAVVANLRVGYGSTLALNGQTLRVRGNVDAIGSISGGTVELSGSDALIGGSLPIVHVSGSARVQRPTVTSGPVSVTGSLSISDRPLSIQIP